MKHPRKRIPRLDSCGGPSRCPTTFGWGRRPGGIFDLEGNHRAHQPALHLDAIRSLRRREARETATRSESWLLTRRRTRCIHHPQPADNLITREHWIGAELDEDGAWLVRAGRIALPFGIRTVEHTLWVRDLTRTDVVDDQQHGVALSVSKDWIRGEFMAIAGNYQLHPDAYRERGYSAYVEMAPSTRFAFGVSSLFTRAERDVYLRYTDYRQAHGLFARYSPASSLVLLAEGDWLYQSLTWNGHRGGFAMFAQADWEPSQGFHFMLTGEAKNDGNKDEPASFAGWISTAWFFGRHVDLRIDDIYQRLGSKSGGTDAFSLIFQLHVFL